MQGSFVHFNTMSFHHLFETTESCNMFDWVILVFLFGHDCSDDHGFYPSHDLWPNIDRKLAVPSTNCSE